MKVILACKKTSKEFFSERYGAAWTEELERFDLERAAVEEEHLLHHESVELLTEAFRQRGVEPRVLLRRRYGQEELLGADLVLSVGGDGELLNVARHIRGRELVLGYRSYHRSAGRLLAPASLTPAAVVERVLRGEYEVREWTRIEGTLHNGEQTLTDLALNEVYIGDRYSVGTARYTLHLGDHEERQRSSGVLVCTGTGSTGWYANVVVPGPRGGGYGQPFDNCSTELRFVVRDPIRSPTLPNMVSGSIPLGETFTIKSTLNADGLVSFDCSKRSYESPRAYPFNRGALLEIRASGLPLRVACLRQA